MKTFAQVRKSKNTEKVINGIKVMFQDDPKGIAVHIDGDKLDVYPDMQRATKMANEFIRQLKGTE